jgi:hypothetical protein
MTDCEDNSYDLATHIHEREAMKGGGSLMSITLLRIGEGATADYLFLVLHVILAAVAVGSSSPEFSNQ